MLRTSKLFSSQSRPKKRAVPGWAGCFWLILLVLGFWVTKIDVQNITTNEAHLPPAGQTSNLDQPETEQPETEQTSPPETTQRETPVETQETTPETPQAQETTPETQPEETTQTPETQPEDTRPEETPQTQPPDSQQSSTAVPAAPDGAKENPPRTARYAGVTMSQEELRELVCVIFLEAGTQSLRGQQAYAEVVLNRVIADNFPDTVHEVLYQGTGTAVPQFSAVPQIPAAVPTGMQYCAVDLALSGPSILPGDVVYCSQTGENRYIWGSIGELVFCYQYEWARAT